MKAIQKSILSLATTLLLATPALAGDIVLKPGVNSIALTNNLAQAVYVSALVTATDYIGMTMQLGAGKTGTVMFSGPVPTSLTAHAFPENGQPLAGHTPSPQGFYVLSVSVE